MQHAAIVEHPDVAGGGELLKQEGRGFEQAPECPQRFVVLLELLSVTGCAGEERGSSGVNMISTD
jgi:hypothetical protein